MTTSKHSNRQSRRRTLWIVVALPLLALVAASISVWMQWRQESLDHRLIQAVKKLDAPSVTRLLNGGASANARDTKEPRLTMRKLLTRLMKWFQQRRNVVASDRGVDALTVLLSKCYDENNTEASDINTAYDTIAVALILHGADSNIRFKNRETPVHIAAGWCLHRTLRLLVSKRADVNARDDFDATPLMDADAENTLFLLQHGGEVNARDSSYGRTPLYYAAIHGRADVVKLLVQRGARVNDSDNDGHSTLYWMKWWNASTVPLLEQYGARLNEKDEEALANDRPNGSQ